MPYPPVTQFETKELHAAVIRAGARYRPDPQPRVAYLRPRWRLGASPIFRRRPDAA